jgi:hypothetical protein
MNSAGSCGTLAVATPVTTLMIYSQLLVLSELLSPAMELIGRGVGALLKVPEVNVGQQM